MGGNITLDDLNVNNACIHGMKVYNDNCLWGVDWSKVASIKINSAQLILKEYFSWFVEVFAIGLKIIYYYTNGDGYDKYVYSDGRIIESCDNKGHIFYSYNGGKIQTIEADTYTKKYSYNSDGLLLAEKKFPAGDIIEYVYDGLTLKTKKVNGQVISRYYYDSRGLLKRIIGVDKEEAYEYYGDGRLKKYYDSFGNIRNYYHVYDEDCIDDRYRYGAHEVCYYSDGRLIKFEIDTDTYRLIYADSGELKDIKSSRPDEIYAYEVTEVS